jgi:hypothetical protein
MQGMHAQHRYAFTHTIGERFKHARDENQMEDLIQRMSFGVGRAFVENIRAGIERELDSSHRDECVDDDGGSSSSIGGEHTANAALSGFVLPSCWWSISSDQYTSTDVG